MYFYTPRQELGNPASDIHVIFFTIEKLDHIGLDIPLFSGLPLVNRNKVIENLT